MLGAEAGVSARKLDHFDDPVAAAEEGLNPFQLENAGPERHVGRPCGHGVDAGLKPLHQTGSAGRHAGSIPNPADIFEDI